MSIIPDKWHSSWNGFMTQKNIEELKKIETKIDKFYPSKENVLRFLNNDLDNVKCIIVGMEPYPTCVIKDNIEIPEATGRSFEVNSLRDKTWCDKFKQSSLRNILKTIYYNETGNLISLDEIRKKIYNKEIDILPPGQWFDSLENQGVMFLNATLTVEPNNVDSHTKYWNDFITQLILYINENNKDVKWLLWGNKAQERILPLVNNSICTQHPRLAGFVGENCFKHITNINWLG